MGISKGGFGSGLGILATPLMALTLPMSQAAAIMLPILCVMDLAGIYAYRGKWSRENMKLILWGGIAGVAVGAFTFRFFDDALLRVGIGAFAIAFVIYRLTGDHAAPPAPRSVPKGFFWSTMAGFTSTLIHAGGPPLNVYLLPQRLEKVAFVATTVLFFTVINYVKLVPYAWLGLFDARNLATSALLIPLAPVGIFMGVWIMKRIPQEIFYRVCYVMLLLVGGKLLYDGIRGWGV